VIVSSSEPSIEIEGLAKRYGDKVALADLSLTVGAGEVMGFLGPNGSGKTTTIRLLMGLLRPSGGRARILGRDCFADAVALKRDIGYLPDEPFLYPYLTAEELLSLVGKLHGFAGGELRRRVGLALERFGLAGEARGFTVTFSHGMKKRLALAAATLHDPRVLILDEPTNGLDPRGARDMRAFVTALAAEGRTVFLSTHLLESAERLCHRVAIITAGQLRAVGTPAELRARHAQRGAPRDPALQDPSLEDLFLAVTEAP
jgi:ABC-2 type transport system ATP-binding protein